MDAAFQPSPLEIPEQPVVHKAPPADRPLRPAKLKPIDRGQSVMRLVVVEELVGPDHKVRAIWDLTGELDLSQWVDNIRSREGSAGRPAWDPRLLLSVWVYAYSEQVTSAREIEKTMPYEPGLMWLSGLGEVNYHTLSDFRSEHPEKLKELLAQLLGLLSAEGLVKLECVAHDGTKVRTQAGSDSFRREKTLNNEIAKARRMVEELDRAEQSGAAPDARREAARKRAARERLETMKQAAKEIEAIRANKDTAEEEAAARVSLTEPEARVMKHGDGALAPSYNVQISTDSENKIVVGVHLTQSSSDSGSLKPAMDEIKAGLGQYPRQAVADGGFTNQKSIVEMKEEKIDFYGSLASPADRQKAAMKAAGIDVAFAPNQFVVLEEKKAIQCPAGKKLDYVGQSRKNGNLYYQYRAQGSDCGSCEFRKQCCPKNAEKGRMVGLRMSENADVAEFREKMKGEEAKAIYKKRGEVAEFPNSWIKEKLGVRKFRLRGMVKATTEAMWAVLTYNVMQWKRLSWSKPAEAMEAAMVAA